MNRKSYLISALVVVVIAAWMASGYIGAGGAAATARREPPPVPLTTVQVRESVAQTVVRRLESQGEAIADRAVELRAETTGRVVEVLAERGAVVSEGDPIVRLSMEDRQARLERAQAVLAQREADYEAARRLGNQGLQAQTLVSEAYAALQTARAELAAIEEEIADTVIRAPFDGVINARAVEVGDYLSPGDPVGEIVDLDPLRVVIHVAQQDIHRLEPGIAAEVRFTGGTEREGEVTFIARAGDRDTHTFRVEVAVPNPDALPSGLSATVTLPLEKVEAHFLSPAVLALDESGVLGAKAVNEDGRVVFHPVEMVRADLDGVWVTGLPERLQLVTIGQGYVRAGEPVEVVKAEESPIQLDSPTYPEELANTGPAAR
jgi:multidrug efflux system membrane fusion protein